MAKPTEEEVAAARAVLAAADTTSDKPRKALVDLVASAEFGTVDAAMKKAQVLNPADVDLSYAIAMFDRLRSKYQVT